MRRAKNFSTPGFTIVELLVVIVVIGILAAITTVSYTGINSKATVASLMSDLDNASKQLKLYNVDHGYYPTSINTSGDNCPTPTDAKYCLKSSNGNGYLYTPGSGAAPQAFYLSATKGSTTYKVTNDNAPIADDSANGQVLRLDASVAASYSGSGLSWIDISGGNHNGTLAGGIGVGGLGYDTNNGGSLSFDGVDDKASYTSGGFLPTGNSARSILFWFKPNSGMTDVNGAFSYGCTNAEGRSCATAGVGNYVEAWANTTNIGLHLQTCQLSGPSTPSPTTGWHLYTAVFNGGGNTVTFYIDGSSATTVTASCTINTNIGTGFALGVDTWGYYSGQIGSVSIYNIALDSSQVSQNFNALRSRFGI